MAPVFLFLMVTDQVSSSSTRQSSNHRAYTRTANSGSYQCSTTGADRAANQCISFRRGSVTSCERQGGRQGPRCRKITTRTREL
jgi:hypothetical protein